MCVKPPVISTTDLHWPWDGVVGGVHGLVHLLEDVLGRKLVGWAWHVHSEASVTTKDLRLGDGLVRAVQA